eukprot:scaffold113734_cov59-Phaeocystis_antarctica.AAC.1
MVHCMRPADARLVVLRDNVVGHDGVGHLRLRFISSRRRSTNGDHVEFECHALAHAKGPPPREERRTHHDLVEVARFHMKHGMTLVCAAATAATVAATVAATAAPGRERATVAA